jgi:hypothetical protein
MVDDGGRLELDALAAAVGWVCSQVVGVTVEAGQILRISDLRGAFIEAEGFTGRLDELMRLPLPEGVRARTGLVAGASAVAFITIAQGLAILPVARLAQSTNGCSNNG